MIVVSSDSIRRVLGSHETIQISFSVWDNGDVYNSLRSTNFIGQVHGAIRMMGDDENETYPSSKKENDKIRVLILVTTSHFFLSENSYKLHGFVRENGVWRHRQVQEISVKGKMFSRFEGLLETDSLANKKVAIFGLGSGGSYIALELCKSSVMNFLFMDHDRLEVGNVMRHASGLSHIGRYKTDLPL